MRPILIEAAMASELYYLVEKLNAKEKTINKVSFFETEFDAYPIVLMKTKVGEINSAISNTVAMMTYNPCLIINIGTGGGYGEEANVGDIVVGKSIRYISQYVTSGDIEPDFNCWKKDKFVSLDGEEVSYSISDKLLNYLKAELFKDKNVKYATICSGDIWSKDEETIRKHIELYDGLCEVMEATGAHFAADSFNCPEFALRIVSNNEIKGQLFEEHYGQDLQEFVYDLIPKLVCDAKKGLF
ncbi:MAG: 5'-methylthioadenosine/S-adenosylhomocysteine nucleosidase [Clostridia bacterium]|nr:5'-methylthioadenosine/S-adenosylhomocysteine nucleosidase [Clostridia bacterium]